jgi:hypothetical protein
MEDSFLRTDVLQTLTPRERMQARMNARAAKMADPQRAIVYGLNIVDLTSSLPGGITDDDGAGIPIRKTSTGNWSSDGSDTPPLEGPWLFFKKNEFIIPDIGGEISGEEEESGIPFPIINQDAVQWLVSFWDDNLEAPGFDWQSEVLEPSLAEDLFSFHYWNKASENEDTYWEDDSVATNATLWIQPLEPVPAKEIADIPGLADALDKRITFVGVTAISDSALTDLGFWEQLEVTANGYTYYIPVNSLPWA